MTRPLLVLRPEPGNARTVAAAKALGLSAISCPLFAVSPTPWQVPDPAAFDGLLLTSANAVRHAGPGLASLAMLPAWCVGEATAQAAREAGLTIAATGTGDAASLLAAAPNDIHLLHLRGADVAGRAPTLASCVVYDSIALPAPPLPTGKLVALLHSPRAAARFADIAAERGHVRIACFSAAVATAAGQGWESVAIAAQPRDEALLALAAQLAVD